MRLSALDLLKKEQRLQQIVRLIGPDALPDSERLVLTVAEMIKNGFLQQSAFDAVDVYSVPEKQIQILLLMVTFYERALSVIKQGAPLLKVTALPVREEIVRIKSTVPNEKLGEIQDVETHLEEQFGNLERMYRRAGA